MNLYRLGIVDALFRMLEQTEEGDINHTIARYFLDHYKQIGDMNIHDVAADCYTSRSGVRRFCERLGHVNFADFKKECKQMEGQYAYFMHLHERSDFRKWYAQEITSAISEIDELLPEDKMKKICQTMHDAKRVIFLTSYSSAGYVYEFQRALLTLDCVIQIMSDTNFQDHLFSTLHEDDALFVVSVMGRFAKNNLHLLSGCTAKKMLLTTSHDQDFNRIFDDVYYLTKDDYTGIKSVQGKIGVFYTFDLLLDVYMKLYPLGFKK